MVKCIPEISISLPNSLKSFYYAVSEHTDIFYISINIAAKALAKSLCFFCYTVLELVEAIFIRINIAAKTPKAFIYYLKLTSDFIPKTAKFLSDLLNNIILYGSLCL